MADLNKQRQADLDDRLHEILRLRKERDFLIDRICRVLEIAAEEQHILPARIKNIMIRAIDTVRAHKV